MGLARGAFFSSMMLVQTPQHTLEGVETLGIISVVLACAIPPLFYITEKNLKKRTLTTSAVPA
jgi:hypothetical protein